MSETCSVCGGEATSTRAVLSARGPLEVICAQKQTWGLFGCLSWLARYPGVGTARSISFVAHEKREVHIR